MGWFKKREKKPEPPLKDVHELITISSQGWLVNGLAYGGDHQGWMCRKVFFPYQPTLEERGDWTMCRYGSQKALVHCPLPTIVQFLHEQENAT